VSEKAEGGLRVDLWGEKERCEQERRVEGRGLRERKEG